MLLIQTGSKPLPLTRQIEYELSDPTIFGVWTLSASARGNAAQKSRSSLDFEVVDYDPVGFESRVWIPASFVPSDQVIEGWVEAELIGGGAPVVGVVEMNATLRTMSGVVCEQTVRFVSLSQFNSCQRKNPLPCSYFCICPQLAGLG